MERREKSLKMREQAEEKRRKKDPMAFTIPRREPMSPTGLPPLAPYLALPSSAGIHRLNKFHTYKVRTAQCSVCSAQCAVLSVQCTVQCSVFSVQCSVRRSQCTLHRAHSQCRVHTHSAQCTLTVHSAHSQCTVHSAHSQCTVHTHSAQGTLTVHRAQSTFNKIYLPHSLHGYLVFIFNEKLYFSATLLRGVRP